MPSGISLRPFPADAVTAMTAASSIMYDDAAAGRCWAPNASVTTSVPWLVNANPYGVGPADGTVRLSSPEGTVRCDFAGNVTGIPDARLFEVLSR